MEELVVGDAAVHSTSFDLKVMGLDSTAFFALYGTRLQFHSTTLDVNCPTRNARLSSISSEAMINTTAVQSC